MRARQRSRERVRSGLNARIRIWIIPAKAGDVTRGTAEAPSPACDKSGCGAGLRTGSAAPGQKRSGGVLRGAGLSPDTRVARRTTYSVTFASKTVRCTNTILSITRGVRMNG
jgi:hypothetical protein